MGIQIIVSASRIPPRPLEGLRLRCLVAQFDVSHAIYRKSQRDLGTTDGTCGLRLAAQAAPGEVSKDMVEGFQRPFEALWPIFMYLPVF